MNKQVFELRESQYTAILGEEAVKILRRKRFFTPNGPCAEEGKENAQDEGKRGNEGNLESLECSPDIILTSIQTWLRKKKHIDVLVYRDLFFEQTGKYYPVVIRIKDGTRREGVRMKKYEHALRDGLMFAIMKMI